MSNAMKSKAKGLSATSFFDLKAELALQEQSFTKNKATGIPASSSKPAKKPTIWGKQNKGVKSRTQRDEEVYFAERPTLESARAALERKSLIYDKLMKGKSGGLSDRQYSSLLVDFDAKVDGSYEYDSDDVDESLTVPLAPDDDPIVEYEDEFGRIRTARRSEVPRELLDKPKDEGPDADEDIIIRNPVNHFPTYEPTAERIEEIEQRYSEENNPLNVHYDSTREPRAHGAGFYQFSKDEETRRAQMAELSTAHEETARVRQELGAEDVSPGHMEGIRPVEAVAGPSKALQKRKLELEERRKALEAKRRKVKGDTSSDTPRPTEDVISNTPAQFAPSLAPPSSAALPAGASKPDDRQKPIPAVVDPFATLEVQTQTRQSAARQKSASSQVNTPLTIAEADAFLAQLGGEIFQ